MISLLRQIHFQAWNNRGDPTEIRTRFPDIAQVTTLPGENPFRQLPSADLESGKYASLTQIPFPSHTLVVPDSDHTALVKRQNPDSPQTRLMRKRPTNRILFSFWHSPTVGQHVQQTRDYGGGTRFQRNCAEPIAMECAWPSGRCIILEG